MSNQLIRLTRRNKKQNTLTKKLRIIINTLLTKYKDIMLRKLSRNKNNNDSKIIQLKLIKNN